MRRNDLIIATADLLLNLGFSSLWEVLTHDLSFILGGDDNVGSANNPG